MIKKILLVHLFIPFIFINSNSCLKNGILSSETMFENIPSSTAKIMDTTFISKYVKDSIKIDVSLPSDYENNPDKLYKVIYMTDGYWRRSEHVTIHQMSDNKEIDEVIVVGIGYPDDYDFNNIRIRDLIIHASSLFSCIKEEVIPYIDEKYHADKKNRTLWGSSYGGYFLVWSFTEHFKQGELFRNYICASAALNPPYKHDDLIKKENELWTNNNSLPVNLYFTVGGNETKDFIDSYKTITNTIKSHSYKNFHFEYEIIPNTDHYSVWKPTLLNGLKKFLNRI